MPPGHPAPSSSLATFKTRLSSLLQLLWNDFFCIILLYYPAPSSSFATFKTRLSSSLQLLWTDFFCIIHSLLCFSIFPVQLFLFSIFAKCPSVQIFLLPVRRSVWVSFLLSATFSHHSFQLKRHFHIMYLFCAAMLAFTYSFRCASSLSAFFTLSTSFVLLCKHSLSVNSSATEEKISPHFSSSHPSYVISCCHITTSAPSGLCSSVVLQREHSCVSLFSAISATFPPNLPSPSLLLCSVLCMSLNPHVTFNMVRFPVPGRKHVSVFLPSTTVVMLSQVFLLLTKLISPFLSTFFIYQHPLWPLLRLAFDLALLKVPPLLAPTPRKYDQFVLDIVLSCFFGLHPFPCHAKLHRSIFFLMLLLLCSRPVFDLWICFYVTSLNMNVLVRLRHLQAHGHHHQLVTQSLQNAPSTTKVMIVVFCNLKCYLPITFNRR